MALPTTPHTQGGDPQAFLRDVMGVGIPPDPGSFAADTDTEEESVFAGAETLEEFEEKDLKTKELIREREGDKAWQELQPRVQEYADSKALRLVLVVILVLSGAVFGALALVNHFQADAEPVVIQQDTGYQVPEELLSE